MRRSSAISGYVATMILVVISLSLTYVVYEGVSRLAPPRHVVFTNQVSLLGGAPSLLAVQINSSSAASPRAFEADDAGSQSGILYLGAEGYGTSQMLCLPDATTFFSVYAPTPGLVVAASNGRVWIDGFPTGSLGVQPGWHEVMISDASSCQITTPGGIVSFPGNDISSIPISGAMPSESLTFWIPTDGLQHTLLMVFDGGYDRLA